jgi:hypothetical protein
MVVSVAVFSQESVKKIVFEEQRIEGKIRRPQLVLIKADQRPDFTPMVLQSMGTGQNIIQAVSNDLIDDSPFKGAFQFEGTEISNLQK